MTPPATRINLSFFVYPRRHSVDYFTDVAERIRARYPRINATTHSTKRWLPTAIGVLRQLGRPTLSIELDRVRPLAPMNGYRLQHVDLSKIVELKRLDEAGIPVPRWVEIVPETKLDPAEWGPYVLTKPSNGKRGAFVWVQKTGRVRHKPPEELKAGHLGRDAPMIAQEFIFTGPMPVSYRILTYLGRPVGAIRYEGRVQRPLEARFAFKGEGGHNVVATAKGAKVSLVFDEEILDLARRVHTVFPEVPTLGTDIIRDVETGKLYVLECNPAGHVWMLSTRVGQRMEQEFGFDMNAQFNAPDIVAEASAEAALRLAI